MVFSRSYQNWSNYLNIRFWCTTSNVFCPIHSSHVWLLRQNLASYHFLIRKATKYAEMLHTTNLRILATARLSNLQYDFTWKKKKTFVYFLLACNFEKKMDLKETIYFKWTNLVHNWTWNILSNYHNNEYHITIETEKVYVNFNNFLPWMVISFKITRKYCNM